VEAPSREVARRRVSDLGEMVGQVRLVEIVEDPAADRAHLPGRTRCPRCGGTRWRSGREFLIWLGVIFLFPLGALLLLIPPTHRCLSCGYCYKSHSVPVQEVGVAERHGLLYQIVYVILVAVAIVGGLVAIGLLFAR
jgi:hypothetical protein